MALDPYKAAEFIKNTAPGFTPRVGIILGSGLGGLAEKIDAVVTIGFDDIPDFPRSTVEGHDGQLILGRLGGMPVVCMKGRIHLYEGGNPEDLAVPVRTMKLLGIDILLVTNAAGSFHESAGPGSLMLISDHINLTGRNPLVGENDDRFGPRFFPMTDAYDPTLRAHFKAIAEELDIPLSEGVYLHYLGPNFETPAEIRAFRVLGADAVGMSTTPEVLVARHCGLRVAAISNITNLVAGLSKTELSHQQTLDCAKLAAEDLEKLVIIFLETLKRELLKAHLKEGADGNGQ
ncbi:purine-nucleoside phosphorylase [Sneathiella chinensis]|uniref:Purine nucleoside phosphorylase n=1 Tax=Sneathiella chinensis TaxID=349750 RepID=A0ABQ5U4K3_9PROT|nr:purine-nucleoside phosphorylase [Sneathiella chinensis]GLQ06204.1 purine nucleoside phosphorylase [Sneathiella chinensis]